jgi:uncharacterized protein YegL
MLFFSAIHAQENLVFNPSAEETEKSKPIHFYNTVYNQPGVYFVDGWFNPNGSSADYYNREKSTLKGHGMNKARTGEGRLAIVASSMSWNDTVNTYKEYVMGQLLRPLDSGKTYRVEFFVVLAGQSRYASDELGAFFSDKPVSHPGQNQLPVEPQVQTEEGVYLTEQYRWTRITGTFVAQGGERYITIGCFNGKGRQSLKKMGIKRRKKSITNPTRRVAYYYIDDVCVSEVVPNTTCACESKKTVSKYNRMALMVDVSGSMAQNGKLDSVKTALKQFISKIPGETEISIITFSDQPEVLLDFTKASEQALIMSKIDGLKAGGYTNFRKPLELAYKAFLQKGENAVVLFTDGVFLVDAPSEALVKRGKKDKNISFTVFHFGDRENQDLRKLGQLSDGSYHQGTLESLKLDLQQNLITQVESDPGFARMKKTNPFRLTGTLFEVLGEFLLRRFMHNQGIPSRGI